MRLTFVLFQMSQLRAAKRVCKNPGTKAYYLTKSVNDVDRREWLYRDGAARKVLGDRDFVFLVAPVPPRTIIFLKNTRATYTHFPPGQMAKPFHGMAAR